MRVFRPDGIFALPDYDIKRRLPCSYDLWGRNQHIVTPLFKSNPHLLTSDNPSLLSPMTYLVQALDLCGRGHTLHLQVIDSEDSRARERRKDSSMTLASSAQRWFADLPIVHGCQTGMTLLIQAIHHTTLLKLCACYTFPALSDGAPVEPFTSMCLSSARAIVSLSTVARDIGFASSSSPLFIFACWVAARNLFVHAFLTHQSGPDADFDVLVNALKNQAVYWPLARQYVQLLESAKTKWSQQTTRETSSLPEAVHNLLDLRRTVYSAMAGPTDTTSNVSAPDVDLSHLPAWAVQPLLGDLHSWFDFPAGFFDTDQ